MKAILNLMLLIVVSTVLGNASAYKHICRLFKNDTKIRHPLSPKKYIHCNGTIGETIKCPKHNIYDGKLEKCVNNRYLRKFYKNACWNMNNTSFEFFASARNCQIFYFCLNKEIYRSTCERDYHFDPYRKQCVPPHEFPCIKNVNLCNFVADNTSFLHESNCSKYYKCEYSRLKVNDCKDQYFNVKTGTCQPKTHITCIHHPATSTTCLKDNKPFVGAVSDNVTCQGYFNCTDKGPNAHDLHPKWMQCNGFSFFSQTKQDCRHSTQVKCKFNRCEGHDNGKAISEKNNCRNYFECEDNSVISEKSCEDGYRFDEVFQKCHDNFAIRDPACYNGPN